MRYKRNPDGPCVRCGYAMTDPRHYKAHILPRNWPDSMREHQDRETPYRVPQVTR